MAMRLAAPGALIALHSIASTATAMAISTKKIWSTKTAISTTAISTTAESARCPRFFQSNRLADGEDVIYASPAIAPVALAERLHGLSQVLRAIVGPKHVLEDQLGIGRLPEQEVGQPLFAAGADDQVGRQGLRGGQRRLEGRLVDSRGVHPAIAYGHRQLARRVGDVGAAAIVEGDLQQEAVVVLRAGLRPLDDLQYVRAQPRAAADNADAHALAVQPGQVGLHIELEQGHELGDLMGGSAPVLGRKAEDGQLVDAQAGRGLDRALQRGDP